jgi:hypothetical protein
MVGTRNHPCSCPSRWLRGFGKFWSQMNEGIRVKALKPIGYRTCPVEAGLAR